MHDAPVRPGGQHPLPSRHYRPRGDGTRPAPDTEGPDDAVTAVLAYGRRTAASS